GAARGAPNLAASMNIAAFNLGNAIGAGAGGAVLALGFGYLALPVAGAALAAAALVLLVVTRRWTARGAECGEADEAARTEARAA
ncbi:MAG: MFS transporter, partial [Pseudomonadota bacterium]|nr:MFS transporter [Pseudomonadota bacterium]